MHRGEPQQNQEQCPDQGGVRKLSVEHVPLVEAKDLETGLARVEQGRRDQEEAVAIEPAVRDSRPRPERPDAVCQDQAAQRIDERGNRSDRSPGQRARPAVSRSTKAACRTGSSGVSRRRVVTAAIMISRLSIRIGRLVRARAMRDCSDGRPRRRRRCTGCFRECRRRERAFPRDKSPAGGPPPFEC